MRKNIKIVNKYIANLTTNPDHWAKCRRLCIPWVVYEKKGQWAEVHFELDTVSPATVLPLETLTMIDALYDFYKLLKPEVGEGKNVGTQRYRTFLVLATDAEIFSHQLWELITEGLSLKK